ncbi:hypothetical protein CDAR_620881 [Caerostris darwini]|uniref:Uncharacterized protein n=1 Tax=Caerostris darwini TaxID=1538125 RepID=A0AAV4US08_9ARAC|nr:hypothetical protein CDAR_620881 [Caerostris darwini]
MKHWYGTTCIPKVNKINLSTLLFLQYTFIGKVFKKDSSSTNNKKKSLSSQTPPPPLQGMTHRLQGEGAPSPAHPVSRLNQMERQSSPSLMSLK